jgi:hypothetical protein|tara:strand:+ start:1071 stop:1184 length:114 start_codon:yes stop_codon:yes gene_type:complete
VPETKSVRLNRDKFMNFENIFSEIERENKEAVHEKIK